MTDLLQPIARFDSEVDAWSGATWIGQIDESGLTGERLNLAGGEHFSRARLLVWSQDVPRGFVEVAVSDGAVTVADAEAEVAELPEVEIRPAQHHLPPISVVVCTRDRPGHLRDVLENLVQLQYPHFEVLVVDNNPDSGLTPAVVESFAGRTVRMVDAPGEGLSIARNVALRNAKYNVVAFTDDDVLVDPHWLTNLAYGFGRDERVACVCGMVPSAEVLTPAQSYFDRRVGWARRCDAAVYDLASPPDDDSLFPLRVAQFGTGANFAVHRDAALELGGFDEGLGVGSPTGGGEDIDMFVRILLSGHMLVREPSAVVWHRHRRTAPELEVQIRNYGLGLGAWIAKLVVRPRTLGMVLHRLRPGVRHLRGVTVVDQSDTVGVDPGLEGLDQRELRGVLKGPFALIRARVAGRKAAPLKSTTTGLARAIDFRGDQMWGDPNNAITAGRLALTAVALSLVGALGAVPALPSLVLALAVGAFTLAGPGSLALSWYTHLPAYALVPLVLIVSVAVCLLVVTGLLMVGFYSPVLVLLALTSTTVVGAVARCGYLAQRKAVRAP
jgi:GT2 family glycosyltransferase